MVISVGQALNTENYIPTAEFRFIVQTEKISPFGRIFLSFGHPLPLTISYSSPHMRYGDTPKSIFPPIQLMLLFGSVLGISAIIAGAVAGWSFETRQFAPMILFLALPAIMFIALLPTLLLCIKLEDGQVKHVFLNRYVLSQYPAADFVELKYGRSGGRTYWPQIRFTNKRTMYFYGMHLGICSQLNKDLKAARDASATHE